MDIMKWLNSLDELLYEVMSWLLFLPLTIWRAAVRPLRTMAEVERQAVLPEEQRYLALLSPPLFLALVLLLAHGVATALGETDAIVTDRRGLAALVDDDASALALRTIVFAAFALFLAERLLRARHVALDRGTLRGPFFAQCYPTAVFALGTSLGTSLAAAFDGRLGAIGGMLAVLTTAYYAAVEVLWFKRQLGGGWIRAAAFAATGLAEGAAFLLLAGYLFTR